MGWGFGINNACREVGYNVEATCDHPGCNKEIDRGLSYVCGDMHDADEYSCDRYFCEEHKNYFVRKDDGTYTCVCEECAQALLASGEWIEDRMEGVIVRTKDD